MPNGTYGGVRGERESPLLDLVETVGIELLLAPLGGKLLSAPVGR